MTYAMNRCRITVLKRNIEIELAESFLKEEDIANFGKCHLLTEGDTFVCAHPFHMPEGFPCDGAWADIRHIIIAMAAGADFPWIKNRNIAIAACADVFKPVIFKIERLPD
jgi:uncharacterized repeat protein (TIGR04076 family)